MSFAEFLFGGHKQKMSKDEKAAGSETSKPQITLSSKPEEIEAALNFYKKKRASTKAAFTRSLHAVRKALDDDKWDDDDCAQAKVLVKTMSERMEELQAVHEQVIVTTEEPDDQELCYLDEPEELFNDAKLLVAKKLKKRTKDDSSDDDDSISVTSNASQTGRRFQPFRAGKFDTSTITDTMEKHMFALMSVNYTPNNEVPVFDGTNFQEYYSFRTAWESADKKLSNMGKTPAEKLLQLKKCLSGKALKYIASLPDSYNENYLGALQMLDSYYLDNQVSAKMTIDKFTSLPKSDGNALEDTYFELLSIYQSLKGLQLTADQCNTLYFTAMAVTKLPNYVVKEWSNKCDAKRDPNHPLGHSADEMDLFECIKKQLKLHRDLSSPKKMEPVKKEEVKKESRDKKSMAGSFSASNSNEKNCKCCKEGNHALYNCPTFKEKSLDQRWQYVKKYGLCYLCMKPKRIHKDEPCKFKACIIDNCGKPHNRTLHKPKLESPSSNSTQKSDGQQDDSKPEESPQSMSVKLPKNGNDNSIAILQSCLAWLLAPSGEKMLVRVFLDGGSELNLIRRKLAQTMGLNGKSVTLQMNVAGGSETAPSKEKEVEFKLEAVNGKYTSPVISATTIKAISKDLREIPLVMDKFPHLRGLEFTEKFPRPTVEVDVMIGLPYYTMLLAGTPITGKPKEPVALPTKLGYVLTGSYQTSQKI